MEAAEAEMTGEADQEALDEDTQDPALDQMIAAEKAATMADVVMTAETVEETVEIVRIAETETTDAQDLPLLVGTAAVVPLAETTRSLANSTSRRTTPRPRSTTTTNPALLSTNNFSLNSWAQVQYLVAYFSYSSNFFISTHLSI